jgi:serine/threonine protein kinase
MTTQENFLQMLLEGCEFHGKLGSSALGILYHITHPTFGACALKIFDETITRDQEMLQHFLTPLTKLQEIHHPNLGKIYQIEAKEYFFIVRELVLGASLDERLKMNSKLSVAEASQIVWDVAMGLFAGYPLGIVYKNIKPGNIILLADHSAKLVDISLPATDPHYIAPEQWQGEYADSRCDIYSLGIVYYQMLTGELPFVGESKNEIRQSHLDKALHLPPEIPATVADIVKTMLVKEPDSRYHSPLPLLGALRTTLKDMGVKVKPMSLSSLPTVDSEAQKLGTATPFASPKLKKGNAPAYTTMMVAFSRDQVRQEASTRRQHEFPDEPTRRLAATEMVAKHFKDATPVEIAEIEEVYLSRRSLEETPEKALERLTYIAEQKERGKQLPVRVAHFPKEFERKVVEHLQKTFRRETWLLKESATEGEMEVEIDLEQSYILRHFYHYEDLLQAALQEVGDQKQEVDAATIVDGKKMPLGDQETVSFTEEEVICLSEKSSADTQNSSSGIKRGEIETVDLGGQYCLETINDITIKSKGIKSKGGAVAAGTTQRSKPKKYLRSPYMEVVVDFSNAYQTMGWVKFVREHNLKKGQHFAAKETSENEANRRFVIYLEKLENYHREQENIARIKEFYQGDYDITDLDRGGMGVVLKLTAKNDPTLLSLRPENYWARQRFAEYLHVRKDSQGREIIYAEIPKGAEFVVKVAFEGYEDSLIQEARMLSQVAEDPNVCETIIGSVQQGRLFTMDEESSQMQIGYYLMLEYAAHGNSEQLYRRFPDGRLSPTVAFAIMFGMVQTLQKLQQKGIIHRDIKPHNILVDTNGVPKLSDFGLAITTKQDSGVLTEERRRLLRIMDRQFLQLSTGRERAESHVKNLQEKQEQARKENNEQTVATLEQEIAEAGQKAADLKKQEEKHAESLKGSYRLVSAEENASRGKFAGSIHYASPEQFDTQAILTPKCDVYQLGASMYTLLTGRRPIEGKTTVEIMSRVVQPARPKVEDVVKGKPVINALSEVIHRMMAYDPVGRIEIDEVREEMDRILFEHALELKEMPKYEKPDHVQNQEQEERWARRVALAEELHHNCLNIIFSTIFKNQDLPALRKDIDKIVFKCPHCGKKLHMYRYMDGKKGTCPRCQRHILVKLGQEKE